MMSVNRILPCRINLRGDDGAEQQNRQEILLKHDSISPMRRCLSWAAANVTSESARKGKQLFLRRAQFCRRMKKVSRGRLQIGHISDRIHENSASYRY